MAYFFLIQQHFFTSFVEHNTHRDTENESVSRVLGCLGKNIVFSITFGRYQDYETAVTCDKWPLLDVTVVNSALVICFQIH